MLGLNLGRYELVDETSVMYGLSFFHAEHLCAAITLQSLLLKLQICLWAFSRRAFDLLCKYVLVHVLGGEVCAADAFRRLDGKRSYKSYEHINAIYAV